ncbi:PRC-barrel domain-containing protein [Pseudooceanicola algae]|uniref:Uncharacterized protein n=1 Tax=Pseudooceanicola algae TaxID=1537215 RepID=A0A418SKC9_9RHOB|nr:PRC-barrel domain-containing protein [Pseudooceanicola algae]QPM89091.1 hypothetical protein PSAL_003010 [Pseudooceanicola algae]
MTFKKTLMSGVAAIALVATPVVAQEATSEHNLTADVNAEANANADNTMGEDLAQAADSTGDAIESGIDATGDAISDTADSMGTQTEDYAQDVDQITDTGSDDMATDDLANDGAVMPSTITAGSLIGTDVKSGDGETIGEIDNVVLVDGKEMAIVGIGGFLGLGEHDVAMPLEALSWSGEELQAGAYTKAELEAMAEFDPEASEEINSDEPVMLGKS